MVRKIIALILCTMLSATKWASAAEAPIIQGGKSAAEWAVAVRQADESGYNFVEFRLSDRRKVKGYLRSVYPDSCIVQATAGTVEVSYSEIQSAKWKQRGQTVPAKYANHALSRPAKYALILGIGLALGVLAAIWAGRS
ncbi:MAG: hypothetical protein LC126_24190 [Bryobacterales bacterium]|nr:hypothetical protein [Bryobacterales bacterium]